MNNFDDRLKQLRIEKGILQRELADHLKVSRVTVTQYESGNRSPDDETKKKIAEYFNVSLDYLMGNSDIRNPYKENSKEKYPKSTELIEYVIEEAGKQGYNLKDKSKEELAEIIVKALKIDEITKSN